MPNALPNPTEPTFLLTPELLKKGHQLSQASPRKRIIQPIQRDQNAAVQRLLNFLQPGTYIRPHCHPEPHATETIIVLEGKIELLLFTPEGAIIRRQILAPLPHPNLVDLEPNLWHSFLVLEPDTLVVEFKHGPYHPAKDKTFADWAPHENSPETASYLLHLKKS
jgi:cupin fold WbuC family metalloprotein